MKYFDNFDINFNNLNNNDGENKTVIDNNLIAQDKNSVEMNISINLLNPNGAGSR